jgi:mannan endo-1,4-beta-mannosidase
LEDPHVDFVQTHHYEKDPRAMIDHIRRNRELTRDKKPYFLGEFGFLGTEALGAVMDTVIDEQIAGALLWSLRPHNRDGGFYWHQEPLGGDYFKAYHWPGFCIGEKYDERRLMRRVREKAYQIRGLTPPPLSPPAAPRVLSVDGGAQITWQGSTGANGYDIQRADALEGPWISVGSGVSDARVQYRPLFVDESARPGKSYDYRVIARNAAGGSKPSPVVGPVRITHQTLVDELWNGSRIFLKQGQFQFLENQTRKYKEDCHRLSGTPDSFLVYYVPGGVDAVRILLFAPSDKPALRISFSRDGRNFEPVEPRTMPTITYGESAYGYVKAVRYSAKPHAAGENYVKLEFLTEAQISRIEIDHDRVD